MIKFYYEEKTDKKASYFNANQKFDIKYDARFYSRFLSSSTND